VFSFTLSNPSFIHSLSPPVKKMENLEYQPNTHRRIRDLSHGRVVKIAHFLIIFFYIHDLRRREVVSSFRRTREQAKWAKVILKPITLGGPTYPKVQYKSSILHLKHIMVSNDQSKQYQPF
jgi:hypothetical protein